MGRALHNALHRPMRRKGFWRAASWRRCAANALQAVRIGFEMVLNL
jgi:hypothetical protein